MFKNVEGYMFNLASSLGHPWSIGYNNSMANNWNGNFDSEHSNIMDMAKNIEYILNIFLFIWLYILGVVGIF